MKRLLIILFLLCPVTSWGWMGVHVAGSGVPSTSAETEETCSGACLWVASWTGSDVLNTGTSYEWDSETDTGSYISQGTTANNGYNGTQSKYFLMAGTLNSASYISENITDTSSAGVRVAIYVATGFSGTGTLAIPVLRNSSLGSNMLVFTYGYDGSDHYLKCQALNSSSVLTDLTDGSTEKIVISTGTWYQLEAAFQKNTSGDGAGAGAKFQVYSAAGQVGTEKFFPSGSTTRNNDVLDLRFGMGSAPSVALNIRFDVLKITNTYDYPGRLAW